jgi:probable F420-dependent oxidoreductase
MARYALILGGHTLKDTIRLAQQAEDAGFDSLWAAELHREAFTQLAAVAPATRRIKLGTGIVLAFTRSPMITALTALDLDELSEGRLIVGLGTGVKRLNEAWHNVPYGKPAPHVRETAQVLRLFMERVHLGEPIRYEGEYYKVDVRGYQRPHAPVRDRIPVYLAGIGPVMCRVAGEVGDGWLGHSMNSIRYTQEVVLPNVLKGLKRSGRDRKDFEICMSVTCAISNDRKAARRAAAGSVAFYSTVRTYEPMFAMHGFGEEARRVQEAFRRGDREAMIDAVSDEMLDAFAIAGTPDEVRERVKAYDEVADVLKFNPPPYFLSDEEVNAYQNMVLETFGR